MTAQTTKKNQTFKPKMPEEKEINQNKKFSIDWLIRGVLTKLGDTFDKLTGRRWSPSSSLATSELTEKLKKLLDTEIKKSGPNGRFVPHNIKLKMQWDKFSTDSDKELKKLENELLIAAIDHINDNRYHTFAPLKIEVKPDYFTEGVKLLASFDKFDDEEREVAIKVTVPDIKVGNYLPVQPVPANHDEEPTKTVTARFSLNGKDRQIELSFRLNQRRSIGRSQENDLPLEDSSVSKIHATLVLNGEKKLMVADTGSTNGTFINDQRISYGQAFPVTTTDKVKFGNVEVHLDFVPEPEISSSQSNIQTVSFDSQEHLAATEHFVASEVLEPIENPPKEPTLTAQTEVLPENSIKIVAPEKSPETIAPKQENVPKNEDAGTSDRIQFNFPDDGNS